MKKTCRHCHEEFKTDSPKAEFCGAMACRGERAVRANERRLARENARRSSRRRWAGIRPKRKELYKCLKCDRLQERRICGKCRRENAKVEG